MKYLFRMLTTYNPDILRLDDGGTLYINITYEDPCRRLLRIYKHPEVIEYGDLKYWIFSGMYYNNNDSKD